MTIESLSAKSSISVSKISALENNRTDNVSIRTLIDIADALSTDLCSLVSEIHIGEYDECLKEFDEEDCINLIAHSDIIKTYYPPMLRDHEISSLLEFIVILPMLDPLDLYDNFERILCSTNGSEDYISEQISSSWKKVPDSPVKQYCERELASIRKIRQTGTPDLLDSFSIEEYKRAVSDFPLMRDYIEKRHSFLVNLRHLCKNNPWNNENDD